MSKAGTLGIASRQKASPQPAKVLSLVSGDWQLLVSKIW
jgi:hypothetical protein